MYLKLIGEFYVGLVLLWTLLIGAGFVFLGKKIFSLLRAVREPVMVALSTASSEAAYLQLTEYLEKFSYDKRVVGLVLPFGYAFNLDGSMQYQVFASLFIAQAFGIELPLSQQILMSLVLMVSSKGMASVPRGSLVVVAAVIPLFPIPAAGILLVLGVDQLLDMGRTATNVFANSIATAVVARWESNRLPTDASALAPRASVGCFNRAWTIYLMTMEKGRHLRSFGVNGGPAFNSILPIRFLP